MSYYNTIMTDSSLIAELFKAVGTSKAELVREVEMLRRENERMRAENLRLRRAAEERKEAEVWR